MGWVARNTLLIVAKYFPLRWAPYVLYRQAAWASHALRERRLRQHLAGIVVGRADAAGHAARARGGAPHGARADRRGGAAPADPRRGGRRAPAVDCLIRRRGAARA